MPDPTDPRDAALSNIQDTSRAYGRGRRRGSTANVDPSFTAALELTDPEQRRAALAQYARQRAQGLFAPPGNDMPQGSDVVQQAFPQGDAFAPVVQGASMPTQDDVMSQFGPPPPRGMMAGMGAAMAGANDGIDTMNDMRDEAAIEKRNDTLTTEPDADDGISRMGNAAEALEQQIMARRRRR